MVAQPDKAESMKQVLDKMSKGQLRLGSNTGEGGNYFVGYLDNVTLTPIKPHTHVGADGKELTLKKTSDPTCAKVGYEEHYECKSEGCDQWAVDGVDAENNPIKKDVATTDIQIPKLPHTYNPATEVTPATEQTNGKEVEVCSVCGSKHTKSTIYKIGDITLAKTSFVYTGKEIKPEVSVKDSKGNVIAAENYTVTYKNNTNAGKAAATIKFNGKKYEGEVTREFTITAAAPQASLTLNKAKVTLYTGKDTKTTTVKATVKGTSLKVEWRSNKTKVAKVDQTGKITAVGKGTATITAKIKGTNTQKTVTVTVKNPTITVKNGKKAVKNNKAVTVKRKKSVKLTVSVNPKKSGITVKKLSKKDKKIAAVTYKNGKLTIKGKKKGTVTIKNTSGKATTNIKIKVK